MVPVAVAAMLAAAGLASLGLVRTPERPRYVTAPVERGDIRVSVTAAGRVEAVLTVEVGSQLSGRIAELLADFNDQVRAGQPIARLDTGSYAARLHAAEAALEATHVREQASEAAIEKARADLASTRAAREAADARITGAMVRRDNAQREAARRRALLGRGNLATSEAEQAEAGHAASEAALQAATAEVAMAQAAIAAALAGVAIAEAGRSEAAAAVRQQEAEVEQARVDLDRAEIRAPIDGVVIARKVDRGQTVAASLEAPTLFTIAHDLRRLQVHTRVDEADIGRIRPGQPASFTVDAFPDLVFPGVVSQIRKAPELVANVVTYTVLVDALNADLVLLPGMTATVEIAIEAAEGVLKVPNAALRFQPPPGAAGGVSPALAAAPLPANTSPALVWTPGPDGKLQPVAVATGRSDLAFTEILAGPLAPGAAVVVDSTREPGSWLDRLRFGS